MTDPEPITSEPTARSLARRAKARRRRKRFLQRVRSFKAQAGCAQCDERKPSRLTFHHRPGGGKRATVSHLVSKPSTWTRIQEEIARCDILCRSCHQRLHQAEPSARSSQTADFPTANDNTVALETYPVGVPFKVPNRRGLYMRLVPGASSDPNWMPVRALHRGSLTGLAAPTGVRPATDDEVHQELGDPAWLDLVDAGSFDPGRFSRERRTQRDRLAALTHAVMTELLGWEPVEELGKGVCRDALGQFYRNGYTGETSPRSTGDAGKVRIFTPFTDHSNAWVLMHAMTGPGGVLHRVYPSGSPCSGYDVFQEWWRTSDLWALDLPRVANLLTVTLLALAGMKAAELDEMRDGLEQQSMPVWRPSRRVDL